MKKMLPLLFMLPFLLITGCANLPAPNAGSSQSIDEPPFPKTNSIMPLAIGNRWLFSYTNYDSLGKKLIPNNLDLHLSISGGYGIIHDTLERIYSNDDRNYSAYAYKFEWEDQKKGRLVVYRDLYPVDKRGIYIIGDYDGNSTQLYPAEQLWLAYPADSGKTWQYSLDPGGDSSEASFMELVSTHGKFYCPDSSAMTALLFLDCYVYKETKGATVYYYYFNEHVGELGYLQYINGRLRVTYLLKSFTQSNGV
jgi:hypothetical protein